MNKKWIYALVALVGVFLMTGVISAQDSDTPFLGISYEAHDDGVRVTGVARDSAAEEAGLERDDVITAVNGDAATNDNLADLVGGFAVGDTITLDVMRGDESLSLEATLQARPDTRARQQFRPRIEILRGGPYLGVTLSESDAGALVSSVAPDSPAETAGLLAEDVITAIDGTEVNSPAEAVTAIQALEPEDVVTLDILRDGEAMTLEATLGTWDFSVGGRNFTYEGFADVVIYDGENWRVVALEEDNPLAESGLQAEDLITAFDGESLSPTALHDYLAGLDDAAMVALTVERGDESLEISINAADLRVIEMPGFGFGGSLDTLPFGDFEDGFRQFEFAPGGTRLGVEFAILDADLVAEHDLDVNEGALITAVVDGSPADDAGLEVDDVITAVSGDPVDAERTLRDRLLAYEAGDTVTLDVLRAGDSLSLDVTLAEVDFARGLMPEFFLRRGDGDIPFFEDGRGFRFFFGPDGEFDPEQVVPPVPEVQANL